MRATLTSMMMMMMMMMMFSIADALIVAVIKRLHCEQCSAAYGKRVGGTSIYEYTIACCDRW
jgi:hypothetical protein